MGALVSIVIPTYGRPAQLLDAIDSIFKQTHSNFEVIVVDDNPPESVARVETQQAIQAHAEEARVKHALPVILAWLTLRVNILPSWMMMISGLKISWKSNYQSFYTMKLR